MENHANAGDFVSAPVEVLSGAELRGQVRAGAGGDDAEDLFLHAANGLHQFAGPLLPKHTQAPCCQQSTGMSPQQPPNVTATPGPTGADWPQRPPIINAPDDSKYFKEQPRKETAPPPTNNSSSWQPAAAPLPIANVPPPFAPAQTAQTVKLDRIVFGGDVVLEGELVRGDKTPRPDVKLLFVNANQSNQRDTVTTNHAGRFQVTLASGGWLVYIYNIDGEAMYHSRIEVADDQSIGRIILVNR